LGGRLAWRGRWVRGVDRDRYWSRTSWFGYCPGTIAQSGFDLFQHQGKVPEGLAAQLITETSCRGLSLLPASTALATLERRIVGVEGMGLIISRALAQLWDDFDYVILDNTPSLGVLMVNALAAALRLVIPVQTGFLAIKGMDRMLPPLKMIMRSQTNELTYTIVPTLSDRRTQGWGKGLNLFAENLPGHAVALCNTGRYQIPGRQPGWHGPLGRGCHHPRCSSLHQTA